MYHTIFSHLIFFDHPAHAWTESLIMKSQLSKVSTNEIKVTESELYIKMTESKLYIKMTESLPIYGDRFPTLWIQSLRFQWVGIQ